jgi:hypothetical protein
LFITDYKKNDLLEVIILFLKSGFFFLSHQSLIDPVVIAAGLGRETTV